MQWVRQTRWVEDGRFFTASGISAGMDMALALIERMFGPEARAEVAARAEYIWNEDSSIDPFA
jgi:transcriptional regulator GlxA family with amidase domain